MGRQKRQPVLFEDLYDKPAVVAFSRPRLSSDGGVILLDAMDKKMGLIHRIAQAVHDPVWSNNSSGSPIETEQAAEAFPTLNRSLGASDPVLQGREGDFVGKPW